jgi:hypothetical protein
MRTQTSLFNIIKVILLTTTLIFIMNVVQAQQPAFIGTFKLAEKTILAGTDYANAIPETVKFTEAPGKITVERTEVATDGNTVAPTSTEQLITEPGKAVAGTTADNRKIKTVAVLNGTALTETKEITVPALETLAFRIREVSTLSDDGKTLTLVKTFESLSDPNDKWSVKGIYVKQ